jgi:cell division protease FtsH
VSASRIRGTRADDAGAATTFATVRVEDSDLLRDLASHGVTVTGAVEGTFETLLSWLVPSVLIKISIIPRGVAALGYTIQLPTEDRFLMARSELENKIAVLLVGRAAEEIVYGEVSTGAQDDLQMATGVAKSMVKAYGMSDRVGQVSLERERSMLLLAPDAGSMRGDYSEETAREIDCEVRRIIEQQYDRARKILAEQEAVLREAAIVLRQHETVTGAELAGIRNRAGQERRVS